MLDSTVSLRELLFCYQQLLGTDSLSPGQARRDSRQEIRDLAQDWLTRLMGMDIDVE